MMTVITAVVIGIVAAGIAAFYVRWLNAIAARDEEIVRLKNYLHSANQRIDEIKSEHDAKVERLTRILEE